MTISFTPTSNQKPSGAQATGGHNTLIPHLHGYPNPQDLAPCKSLQVAGLHRAFPSATLDKVNIHFIEL
jgi:hypothetical protein